MRLGTVYRQMPDSAMMSMAGVESMPAFTAVSPSTNAPTTDRAMPTYFGIRTLASVSTSRRSTVRNISRLGESGSP